MLTKSFLFGITLTIVCKIETVIYHSPLIIHRMKIYTYAALKDHFDKEFEMDKPVETVGALHLLLAQRSPAAKDMLAACRFAVKDNFVTDDFPLQPGDSIHIIPPSSGG